MVRLPLPPGTLPTLWQADQRYVDSYLARYPGYYLTGDAGYRDEDGYLFVMSRIDDVINVAGHRLSTGAMEEVLAAHPDVAECAVFGVADELKGELPLGLVVLKAGVDAARGADPRRADRERAPRDRPGRRIPPGHRGPAPAQDALRQDPARHHEGDRRRQALPDAGDDRRPGDPSGDRGGAAAHGLRRRRAAS